MVPCAAGRCRSSAIRSADPHGLLRVGAETQFRRGEQAIDNVGRALDAVIDELGLAGRPDDKERRRLALGYAGWELQRTIGTSLPNIDFCALASGQGVKAISVNRRGVLDEALRSAFATTAEPTLVEVAVD